MFFYLLAHFLQSGKGRGRRVHAASPGLRLIGWVWYLIVGRLTPTAEGARERAEIKIERDMERELRRSVRMAAVGGGSDGSCDTRTRARTITHTPTFPRIRSVFGFFVISLVLVVLHVGGGGLWHHA